MMKKSLGILLSLLGFFGLLFSIFYGYVIYAHQQIGRGDDIQLLGDPNEFTAEELQQINQEVDVYVDRIRGRARGMDNYAIELMGVQQWVNATIRYDSDLRLFGRLEHFATAKEVWIRGADDCDGIAALTAAILRARGVERAKIAVSDTHAEARIGTAVLPPDPPKPKKQPWYRELEYYLDYLIIFPWLRLVFGVGWFTACCSLGMKLSSGKYPQGYILLSLGGVILGSIALEYFTLNYLPNPVYPAIDRYMWASLIFGVVFGGISACIFLFGRSICTVFLLLLNFSRSVIQKPTLNLF